MSGLVICLIAAAAACSYSVTAADVVRVFALQTINGTTLPAPVSRDPFRTVEIVSDSITFFEDGRYRTRLVARIIQGDTTWIDTQEVSGRYTREGSQITFLDEQGNRRGTAELLNEDTLQLEDNLGNVSIFQAVRAVGG